MDRTKWITLSARLADAARRDKAADDGKCDISSTEPLTFGARSVPRNATWCADIRILFHTAGYDGVFGGLATESRLRYP